MDLHNFQAKYQRVVSFWVPVNYPSLNELVSMPELVQCIPTLAGPFSLPLRVEDHSEFHSKAEAFGHMSPHCRFSDLGPFRLRIISAQVGNWTRAHGDESNPLEISMSSAMKGEPGLATGLTTWGALHPFIRVLQSGHRNLCQGGSNLGQGPICILLLYRGSSPFTHCATSAGININVMQDVWPYWLRLLIMLITSALCILSRHISYIQNGDITWKSGQ